MWRKYFPFVPSRITYIPPEPKTIRRRLRWILWIVIALVFAFFALRIVYWWWFYGYFYRLNVEMMRMLPGYEWVGTILALIFTIGYIYLPIRLLFTKTLRKFNFYLSLSVAGFALHSIIVFYLSKDINFGPNGEVLKCEAYNPQTKQYEKVDCYYKKHPQHGTTVRKVESTPIPITPHELKHMRLFSQKLEPLVWYYVHDDSTYEFYFLCISYASSFLCIVLLFIHFFSLSSWYVCLWIAYSL